MANNDESAPGGRADRMAAIEALLIRYPEISDTELAELTRWFKKEASAFEVATLASRDATRSAYPAFRKEHIDRFSARDVILALVFAALVVAVTAGIGILGN